MRHLISTGYLYDLLKHLCRCVCQVAKGYQVKDSTRWPGVGVALFSIVQCFGNLYPGS